MKNIIKTVSLLTLIAVIPGAMAATSRVSVTNNAASRLPSIAGRLISGTTTATTTSSTTAAYYDVADCVEKYEDCLRAEDVCGLDFEECTTNVLFHAQMPKCSSVLYQCSAAGVQQLFGTSAINALSTVYSYVTDDRGRTTTEVARYTYPTENSELNNLIAGAKEGTKLTNEQCVRRYTNCLKRDDVCGSDFELCTTEKAFKKQAMLCDSTFERCPTEAKQELFGGSEYAAALKPSGESRLKQLIDEGNALAALNAVKTCQKVTDNCLISACTKNPLRCVEGISMAEIYTADFVTGGDELNGLASSTQNLTDGYVENYLENQTGSDIRKMLKAQCLETIGSNKYCHMTYREKAPSNKDLVDIDLQEDVFSLAYAARKDAVNTKIQEAVKKFDTKAKNACVDTIKSCTMRSCGGGLGSVCYRLASSLVFDGELASSTNAGIHVNRAPYNEIKSGCEAIVNADANCIYAATSSDSTGYTYTYYDDNEENSAFSRLFPEYSESRSNDPIGAVGKLNSLLATSYNDAAIEQMKKQCQTVALSCVKSMCGKDYTNCYRNRTDIVAGDNSSYDTGNAKFDRSMNKMGGILDYNIVIGLCMNTVKNSPVCEEHLNVATAEWRRTPDETSWNGASSVREGWLDSKQVRVKEYNGTEKDVVVACGPNPNMGSGCVGTMEPVDGDCPGTVDEDGCVYDQKVFSSASEYALYNGANTLFQTLLVDVEKEAQAKYNAKLTKEHNICLSNNNGGLMGNHDTGSTFMWVKLKSSKTPKNYVSKGLKTKQFIASNDLYGSFCRAKITVMSDDKDIQAALDLTQDSVAYFAVGDSFTCGSWIDNSTLQKISEVVGAREVCKQGYGKWEDGECNVKGFSTKENIAYAWATVAPALAGGAIGTSLTQSGLITDWLNKSENKNNLTYTQNKTKCISNADAAVDTIGSKIDVSNDDLINKYLESAYNACEKIAKGECTKFSVDENTDVSVAKNVAKGYKILCNEAEKNSLGTSSITATRIAVPIATALAGGALGAGITASVIKQNKENIKNEAAQKWMDEIGEHIQCYVGTEEVGSYGDVISIELD